MYGELEIETERKRKKMLITTKERKSSFQIDIRYISVIYFLFSLLLLLLLLHFGCSFGCASARVCVRFGFEFQVITPLFHVILVELDLIHFAVSLVYWLSYRVYVGERCVCECLAHFIYTSYL